MTWYWLDSWTCWLTPSGVTVAGIAAGIAALSVYLVLSVWSELRGSKQMEGGAVTLLMSYGDAQLRDKGNDLALTYEPGQTTIAGRGPIDNRVLCEEAINIIKKRALAGEAKRRERVE